VGPLCVVIYPPFFDHDLRLLQGIENLAVQALIPQLSVKAFPVAGVPQLTMLHTEAAAKYEKHIGNISICATPKPHYKTARKCWSL
jgi:hypothetical protein